MSSRSTRTPVVAKSNKTMSSQLVAKSNKTMSSQPGESQPDKTMFSQPGKSQPELYLNDLDLGVTGMIIVMICRIWDVNSTTGRYLSTDFIVSDSKGYTMHCSAKAHVAHSFLKLKEGYIYSVKKFSVVPNKDEYRILKNADCMLEFDGATTVCIAYVSSAGFDRYPFQLVAIDDLEPTDNEYLIDAVGYVTNVGRATQQKTGSRTLDFYLANTTGQSVRITLWGSLGDTLIEKRTAHVGLYPVVLTGLNVKEYNNRLYLSSTSSTLILDDVKIPAVIRLKTDDNGVERTKESLPVDHAEPKEGTLENLLMWARNRKYDTATFHCLVTIDSVRTKKGWNYPSCGGDKCKKGMVNRKGGQFWCDSCNKAVKYPVLRYRLELEVSDETAQAGVVMFDETAAGLVKCSADSILELDDQEADEHPELPQPLANIVGTSHVLELKSHTYYEHQNFESFTCWNVVVAEQVEENPVSPVVDEGVFILDDVDKESELKKLVGAPSIATPLKPTEAPIGKRGLNEDSDAEASFVVESHPAGGEAGCSSGARKKRRMVVHDSD